jgi:polyamine oxidase
MSMHMGSYKKVILTFDHIFWPKKEPFLGLIRDGDDSSTGLGTCLWMDNLWAKDGIPMIEAVLFAAAAQWATGKSDSIVEAAIFEFMTEAGVSPTTKSIETSFVSSHVTRWEEDPYSKGTFSYYGLGTLDRHCDALSEPEWDGCLVLAGEATNSEWQGSVHGALQSGTEAAEQITSFLSKT